MYCRVLELAGEVAYYEGLSSDSRTTALADSKLRAQLERSEHDKRRLERLRERFRVTEHQLQEARLSEQKAEQQRREMEETTTKLTEWNTQLETRVGELDEEIRETLTQASEAQNELEAQLIQATQKRIQLQQEFSLLEEKILRLERQNIELEDIQFKLQQENHVLKSKLSHAVSRNHNRPIARSPLGPSPRPSSVSKPRSAHMQTNRSPIDKLSERLESMDMLDDVELRGKMSLTEIFKSSMNTRPMIP